MDLDPGHGLARVLKSPFNALITMWFDSILIDRLGNGAGALALGSDLELCRALDADLVPNILA